MILVSNNLEMPSFKHKELSARGDIERSVESAEVDIEALQEQRTRFAIKLESRLVQFVVMMGESANKLAPGDNVVNYFGEALGGKTQIGQRDMGPTERTLYALIGASNALAYAYKFQGRQGSSVAASLASWAFSFATFPAEKVDALFVEWKAQASEAAAKLGPPYQEVLNRVRGLAEQSSELMARLVAGVASVEEGEVEYE